MIIVAGAPSLPSGTQQLMNARLSCMRALQQLVQDALLQTHPSLDFNTKVPAFLGVRRSMQRNADYQTSIALQFANRLRENPVKFAQMIIPHLPTRDSSIDNTADVSCFSSSHMLREAFVSNGGFLNFVLDDQWIAQQVVRMATDGIQPAQLTNKSILVDFAAPNLGKKLHVGHLRSSVIGDTICNLLEFRGHKVARISHTGDVGSALATLLVELIEQCVPLDTLSDSQLGQYYESGKKKFVKDARFKARVDDVVIQLQRIGTANSADKIDPVVLQTWERACQVSREAYAKIFDRLEVNVQERGESTYLKLVPEIVEKLVDSGLAVKSRGALCIFVDGPEKPPMLIRKKDGGYLYATVDLACLYSRIHGFPGVDETQYDEILYITDQSQQLHFDHLFKAAKSAGWTKRANGQEVKLMHAPFGLVLGKDGTKLSSRNGAFDYLEDLLNEATEECNRRSLAGEGGDDKQYSDIISNNRVVGDAAIRYFELSQQRERNYKFLFDNVLNLKGNTGVYLMYASARLQGILRKASSPSGSALESAPSWSEFLTSDASKMLTDASRDWHPSERQLALLLCQFDDEVAMTLAQLYPHYLCDYLFRVVTQFHSFYEKCRVLNDPKQESRLLLCAATDAILSRGLQLVGIKAVKHM